MLLIRKYKYKGMFCNRMYIYKECSVIVCTSTEKWSAYKDHVLMRQQFLRFHPGNSSSSSTFINGFWAPILTRIPNSQ